jgi:hypothetical protein
MSQTLAIRLDIAASVVNYQQAYPQISWISFGETQRSFFGDPQEI